ncbi:M14 family metallopeptidase [Aeoliella sp. SH292]|uniref:M14 family metallopeptidase n=1 Tax=Aeoliella sp. SH292 TaxID=3454464 RepID=UPI003F9BF9C9
MPLPPCTWKQACLAIVLALAASRGMADPVKLPGYQSPEVFEAMLEVLADSELVTKTTLGETAEGRKVDLLTIGTGDVDSKPAILLVGSVDAANLVGSEVAVRIVQQLTDAHAKGDESVKELLDNLTLYVIPRPSPDASAHVFDAPTTGRATNSRSTDADRDFEFDEDPNEDLNGDGVITMMRVADPTGPWMEHPSDPRLLVRAEANKKELGQYQLYTEGVDNDHDELWNEDGAGGVDFNRNWTFEYPYFAGDAGPHQVSEPETRAIADWMFTRPNIYMVFSFAPQDNLTKPWGVARDNNARIKKQVLPEDGPSYEFLSNLYGEKVGKENAPGAAGPEGTFAPWAYYHYGRWSIATPGWWIPKVEAKKEEGEKKDDAKNDDAKTDEAKQEDTENVESEAKDNDGEDNEDGKKEDSEAEDSEKGEAEEKTDDAKKSDDKSEGKEEKKDEKKEDGRNAEERNALAWFAANDIDGFVDWVEVDHPDFPGKKVEVGGFKPLVRQHPPAKDLNDIAAKHREFLIELSKLGAKPEFVAVKSEPLGEGVYRVSATLANLGYLPTQSSMGRTARKLQRLDIELNLPEGSKLLVGDRRVNAGVLAGSGGNKEVTWLVRLPEGTKTLELRAGEPSIGFTEYTLTLDATARDNASVQEANTEEASDEN